MCCYWLIECFFIDVLGIVWDDVYEEVEWFEHVMLLVFEVCMLVVIGDVKMCFYGYLIEFGMCIEGVLFGDVVEGVKVMILCFENEVEDLLHLFKYEGLEFGCEGMVVSVDGEYVIVDFGDVFGMFMCLVVEMIFVLVDFLLLLCIVFFE